MKLLVLLCALLVVCAGGAVRQKRGWGSGWSGGLYPVSRGWGGYGRGYGGYGSGWGGYGGGYYAPRVVVKKVVPISTGYYGGYGGYSSGWW